MIVRGTTPSIRYTFSTLNVADIIDAYLTIVQGETVIEKTLQDAEVGEDYLDWTLSQAETVQLDDKTNCQIQCKYKMQDGKVYASKIVNTKPYDILKEDVI